MEILFTLPLHDIRKMYFKPFIYQCADTEKADGNNPEIHGRIKIFPEPLFFIDRTAVAFHNVYERIYFNQHLRLFAEASQIPQNGSRPHAYLQGNVYNLLKIPEINNHRTGCIADSQYKHKHTEAVIKDLQRIQTGRKSIKPGNYQKHQHKKAMDERGRNNFNNRQYTDFKYYFFLPDIHIPEAPSFR